MISFPPSSTSVTMRIPCEEKEHLSVLNPNISEACCKVHVKRDLLQFEKLVCRGLTCKACERQRHTHYAHSVASSPAESPSNPNSVQAACNQHRRKSRRTFAYHVTAAASGSDRPLRPPPKRARNLNTALSKAEALSRQDHTFNCHCTASWHCQL